MGLFSAAALKGFFKSSEGPDLSKRYRDLGTLRLRLLGKKREAVKSMLGLPRTCAFNHDVAADHDEMGAWYYVVGRSDRSAMAVSFEGDIVTEVEFFTNGMATAR
jgi:hypothetical protein